MVTLRDIKRAKLIEVDEPLALQGKERFRNGPVIFDLGDQNSGAIICTVWEGKAQEPILVLHLLYPQNTDKSLLVWYFLCAERTGAFIFHPAQAGQDTP